MYEPLVSIIMGAYNCEATIDTCIRSIQQQTYKNWEFIICDDNSTDNTLLKLKAWSEREPRIKVIHNNKNMRLAYSLNHCLMYAKGIYVARMDADDESLPDRLSEEVYYLQEHKNIDCVGCNRIIFDENGENGIRKSIEVPTKEVLLKDAPFAHPTIMMKKSVYDHLGGYTVSKATMRAEDLDLWFRFFFFGFRGYNLQKELYKYHESKNDLGKRTLEAGIQTARVFLKGYKLLGFSKLKYVYALKPVIAALVPDGVMSRYHDRKLKKLL